VYKSTLEVRQNGKRDINMGKRWMQYVTWMEQPYVSPNPFFNIYLSLLYLSLLQLENCDLVNAPSWNPHCLWNKKTYFQGYLSLITSLSPPFLLVPFAFTRWSYSILPLFLFLPFFFSFFAKTHLILVHLFRVSILDLSAFSSVSFFFF